MQTFGGQRCGTTHIWVVRRQKVKAGGEIDKVKDSVRLVENRVTEIQAAAQNSIQKVNTEIA